MRLACICMCLPQPVQLAGQGHVLLTHLSKALTARPGGRGDLDGLGQEVWQLQVQTVQQLQQLNMTLPSVAEQPLDGQGMCLMLVSLAGALS